MNKNKERVYAFLDTSVLLEFKAFDQIDWTELLGYKEVCLVFEHQSITELDKQKVKNSNERKRERAKKILSKIHKLSIAGARITETLIPGRPNVYAIIIPRWPKLPLPNGLQQEFGDDLIIASILEFQNEHPEFNSIILVTYDTGMLIKAPAFQIKEFQMDEKYLADDQPNDQRKGKSYDTSSPQLELWFYEAEKPTSSIQLNLSLIKDPEADVIESLVEKERKEILWNPTPSAPSTNISKESGSAESLALSAIIASLAHESVPESFLNQYQQLSSIYLENYKNYLHALFNLDKTEGLLSIITLQVCNCGTSAAEGAQIHLHLPKELKAVHSIYDQISPPKKPTRPKKQDVLFGFELPGIDPSIIYTLPNPMETQITYPIIEQRNSFTLLKWNYDQIMHNIPENLDSVGIIFPEIIGASQYTLDYEIHARNLPRHVTGQIIINAEISVDDTYSWFPQPNEIDED